MSDRDFLPIRIAVLALSDTRSLAEDASGDLLVERLTNAGHTLAARAILPDDRARIADQLRQWCADPDIDVILTTGGTGLTGRDVTIEAHRDVYEKEIEAFGTVFTHISMAKIGTSAVQSPRHRGRCQRHLSLRAARITLRLSRRLGRDPAASARLPAQALQFRRDSAST